MHNLLSSGSHGNCVIYNKSIMVDIGVSFKLIEPYINDIQIVLISHQHTDHLNIKTLKKLQSLRPTIRVACGDYLIEKLAGIKNIDIIQIGYWYNYGEFHIAPVKLYHDVKNYGFRIKLNNEYKIFHATDTKHLEGISAKGYNLYSVEHNYDEEKANDAIREAKLKGEYCRAQGSINSHLSYQQAHDFIVRNKYNECEVLELHRSSEFY